MARREWTDRDKANTLAALDANAGNVAHTSRLTGVPRRTLARWSCEQHVNSDVAEIAQVKRRELTDIFLDEIYAIIDVMPTKRRDATYSQLATAAGIFTDKVQLLTGKATERQDVTSGGASWVDLVREAKNQVENGNGIGKTGDTLNSRS